MDMNQQILQKLLEMEEAQKERDAEQQKRDAEQQKRDAAQKERDAEQLQRDAEQKERDAEQKERDAEELQRDAAQKERDAEELQRDAAQKERDAAQKERDAALNARLTHLEAEVAEIRKEQVVHSVNYAKLEGQIVTSETKLGGNLASLEMKLDNVFYNMRDQKADSGERWKVGGIIASCGIAIASLILSILTRFGGN